MSRQASRACATAYKATAAFGADHDHQRPGGDVHGRHRHVAVGGQTHHHATGGLIGLELTHQVDRLRDRDPRGSASRRLPCRRRHPRRAPLGNHHSVRAESRRRSNDRPQVAGVGHAVEGHDQWRLPHALGHRDQFVGIGIVIGRHPRGETLVDGATGHPVEFAARNLQQRQPGLGRQLEGLPQSPVTLGPLGDVDPGHGDPCPQRLDDGVASGDPLGLTAGRATARGTRGILRRALLGFVGLVVGPLHCLGGRASTLEAALHPSTRPGCGLLR